MIVVESAGFTDIGKRRRANEDFLLTDDALGLYIIADGMGGHQAGDVASRLVVETIRDYIRSTAAEPASHAVTGESSLSAEAGAEIDPCIICCILENHETLKEDVVQARIQWMVDMDCGGGSPRSFRLHEFTACGCAAGCAECQRHGSANQHPGARAPAGLGEIQVKTPEDRKAYTGRVGTQPIPGEAVEGDRYSSLGYAQWEHGYF